MESFSTSVDIHSMQILEIQDTEWDKNFNEISQQVLMVIDRRDRLLLEIQCMVTQIASAESLVRNQLQYTQTKVDIENVLQAISANEMASVVHETQLALLQERVTELDLESSHLQHLVEDQRAQAAIVQEACAGLRASVRQLADTIQRLNRSSELTEHVCRRAVCHSPLSLHCCYRYIDPLRRNIDYSYS